MKSMIYSCFTTAFLLPLFFWPAPFQLNASEVINIQENKTKKLKAWLESKQKKFKSGENQYIELTLHIQNRSKKAVTLSSGGSTHGWRWEFQLIGGGAPFVPRWDDDTGGQRAAPREMILPPGESKLIQCHFRQRSFLKYGAGGSSLVPGKYRITAKYYKNHAPKAPWFLKSSSLEIEILPRGNNWDKVATCDNTTMVELLDDQDRWLRRTATAFLTERVKEATPAILRGLDKGGFNSRQLCARILRNLHSDVDPSVIKALAKILQEKNSSHIQFEAARSLGYFRKAAKPAVPALIDATDNHSYSGMITTVSMAAGEALGRIGDTRPEVITALTKLLEKYKYTGNAYPGIAYAIGDLGPKAKDAVPLLLKHLLDEKNRLNRYCVLSAIRGIGTGSIKAVPTLNQMLEDQKEGIPFRTSVAYTLGCIQSKKSILPLKRVRDEYLKLPKGDKGVELFLKRINGAIDQIQRAESIQKSNS